MKNKTPIFIILLLSLSTYSQVIKVNGIRQFEINNSTIIKLDGIQQTTIPIDIIGSGGFKIRFKVGNNVNPTISQGTLTEINLISDIKGPITSTNPLKILDQAVFVTGDTVLENLLDTSSLTVNDLVSVSGAINALDNDMQLSRLELHNSLSQWKLRGFVHNITATSFTIGALTININAVTPTNCNNGFVDNVFVSIEATPDATYSAGNPLTTLTTITCETPDVDEDSNNSVPTVVEGMISDIIDLSSFKINGLTVFFDINTSFDNGEAEHLDIGTKVEVQGLLDTNTRFITADTIRFINHRVKIITPIMPADIILNQSINMLGQTILFTPETRDDDAIMSAGLLTQSQVEMRGFVDSQGQIFAQRVKYRGSPDSTHIHVRGDITSLNKPFVSINNIDIDATNSLFELDGGTVTIDAFFANLQVGMQLVIEDATFNQTTQKLTYGDIELVEQELEDDADQQKSATQTREIIGTGGVGLATVTGSEVIFHSSFE